MEAEVALARKRLIIVVVSVCAIIAIVVGLIILSFPQQVPKTGIRFIVAPNDITVVDQSKRVVVSFESVVAYSPGSYDLTLERKNFFSKEATVVVKEGEVTPLYLALEPSDDIGRRIMEGATITEHAERIGGYNVKKGAEELTTKYTFLDKVPIVRKYYAINPCFVDDKKTIGLCIDVPIDTAARRAEALQALVDAGVDASKWTVLFNRDKHSD